jgi:xylulose-5-phosphate/fructose-6-phosphate phosphoketolase
VPGLEAKAHHAKLALRNHLIEHKLYVARYGIDMPEIRNWQWPS